VRHHAADLGGEAGGMGEERRSSQFLLDYLRRSRETPGVCSSEVTHRT
jgi:hypothetical protein